LTKNPFPKQKTRYHDTFELKIKLMVFNFSNFRLNYPKAKNDKIHQHQPTMFFSYLSLVLLILSIELQLGSCQFYVDIEHALPRFGKRGPGEVSNNMYSFSAKNVKNAFYKEEKDKLQNQIRILYKLLELEKRK
jgi:hypothetical protein